MTPIASCANFVIDHSLSSKSTIFKVREVINYLAELNFRYIIVPLFGESNPESDSSFKIASSIAQLANHASKNKIKLLRANNKIPNNIKVDNDTIVPLMAGQEIGWNCCDI
jgi:dihydroorotase